MPKRVASHQPNLLLIMADQWRFDYVGYAGAGFVNTPNIDRLAASGTVFTHCFTNGALCTPSRIALATGLNTERIGAVDNEAYLPRSVTTYYQRLRDEGYEVGCVGKLDLAKHDSYNGIRGRRPCTFGWGFTDPHEVEGKMHAGTSPTPIGPYTQHLQERGLLDAFHRDYRNARGGPRVAASSVLAVGDFADGYIGRRSAAWILDRTGEYPWHLFVSFVGPHDPYDPPADYSAKNQDQPVPEPIHAELSQRPPLIQRKARSRPDEHTAHARRQYAASIEVIDDMVGEILAALEETGERDNTIIVFTSDHGDMMGDLGLWQKTLPYDPANRVPLCIAGPDIPAGQVSEALVSLFDLNPTLCGLAGLPTQAGIDARSLVPLIHSAEPAKCGHREACYFALRGFRGLRTRDRLYVQHSDGERELYDMEADPHCQRNLAPDLDRSELVDWQRRLIAVGVEGQWRH